jgi:hypothetical protein
MSRVTFLSLVLEQFLNTLQDLRLCNYSLLNLILVSSGTSVAIAFGIFSTVISLLGVWIGYLTLQAMAFENRMHFSPSLTSLRLHFFGPTLVIDPKLTLPQKVQLLEISSTDAFIDTNTPTSSHPLIAGVWRISLLIGKTSRYSLENVGSICGVIIRYILVEFLQNLKSQTSF